MKTILTAAMAIAVLTSAAFADDQYRLTDIQMDQVTAGAGGCGVGSDCLVGAFARIDAGLPGGMHDSSCSPDGCVSYSGGGAFFVNDGKGGGGARFVVDGTVLQTGGGGCPSPKGC